MATIHLMPVVPRREATTSTLNTGERLTSNLHRAITAYVAAYGVEALDLELKRALIKCVPSSERLSLAGEQTWASTKEEFTG